MNDCWQNIIVGMKVEVENRDTDHHSGLFSNSYWVASVLRISGYYAHLRYEGFGQDGSKDFWMNLCSDRVHPVGWCATKGKPLIPPKCKEFHLDFFQTWPWTFFITSYSSQTHWLERLSGQEINWGPNVTFQFLLQSDGKRFKYFQNRHETRTGWQNADLSSTRGNRQGNYGAKTLSDVRRSGPRRQRFLVPRRESFDTSCGLGPAGGPPNRCQSRLLRPVCHGQLHLDGLYARHVPGV